MQLDLYQIDAFTNRIFGGNPACVIPLDQWLPDEVLLQIAKENAVAETAFFIPKDNHFHLRWFTPEIEMDLCGHATLATAHCLKSHMNYKEDKVIFETHSGELRVNMVDDFYYLNFPSRRPEPSSLPEVIKNSLNIQPREVLRSRDYLLVYESEEEVKNIQVNRQLFDQINLDPGGVVVTAKGEHTDFVSRFFTPQASILEDPVTGSAHCTLIPYWSKELNKKDLEAMQVSERVGHLICQDQDDRVVIGGQARTYSVGSCWIDNA